MKSFLRAAAASGLAAATVVSGLAFGPAAATAAGAQAGPPSAGSPTSEYVKFAVEGQEWFNIANPDSAKAYMEPQSTLPQALAGARGVTFPGETWAPMKVEGTGKCFQMYDQAAYKYLTLASCTGRNEQLFKFTDGRLQPMSHPSYYATGLTAGASPAAILMATTGAPLDFVRDVSRTITKSYDKANDGFTLTLDGWPANANIYLNDATGSPGPHVGTTDSKGHLVIKAPRSVTSGAEVYIRAWATGTPHAYGLRPTAVRDVTTVIADGKRWVSGTADPNADIYLSASEIATGAQAFKAGPDGTFRHQVDRSFDATSEAYIYQELEGVRTKLTLPDILTATVTAVDAAAGTAVLAGYALPNAWIEVDGATQDRVQADSEGDWTYTLTDLPFGKTQHTVLQFDGADLAGETSVEVDLAVSPLTVEASFEDTIDAPAALSGTAHPGASVDVTNGSGAVVGRTMANAAGDWTVPVPAPDASGAYRLSVEQKVGGRPAGTQEATIEYGDTVAISIPEDGYDVEPGKALTMIGTGEKHADGEPAAKVKVFEKGKAQDILGTADVSKLGNWQLRTPVLEDREYTLVVQQTGRGGNITRSQVTVNEGKSSVPAPTAAVVFDEDVTKKATVQGTGVDGATITVKDSRGTTLGTTTVKGGTWSTAVTSPGTGTQALTIEQSGIDGVQEATVSADFGAAVTATGPASSFDGPSTTVTGTGADGAEVVLTEGDTVLGKAVVKDGTWSVDVDHVQDGEHAYTATQTARGATVSTAGVTVTRDARVVDVTLTTPESGDTYESGSTLHFEGTGTPGARVVLEAGALTRYETTVAWDGSWSIDRPMNTGRYVFDVVQTAKGDAVSRVTGIVVTSDDVAVDRPFSVTSPESGSTHRDQSVAFTGTGTPGSTITLDPKVANLATVTTTVARNGRWSVERYLGAGAYDFDVVQTSTSGEETGRRSGLLVNQAVPADRPFQVTRPDDGSEHRNRLVTFSGTGTAGSTITAHVANFASADVTTTVRADGTWDLVRYLGGGSYTFEVSQTTGSETTGTTTLKLNPSGIPVDLPFALESPQDGDTYVVGSVEFRGTGAAGATVTVDPGKGLKAVTTIVRTDGTWAVEKYLGSGPYTFTITQDDEGTTTQLAPVTLTAAQS